MTGWTEIAARQHGMLARRQLNEIGIDSNRVRNHIAAGRWCARTPRVISIFTGEMPWPAQVWCRVLHAGGNALVGGFTALEWYGLRNWHRDVITVLVDAELSFTPVRGTHFFRTRRPLDRIRNDTAAIPIARLEPAVLLCAAHERSPLTAQGLLAAVVQQRLTTPERLGAELELLRPLRQARRFRQALVEIAGGSESMAELDVIAMCRRHGFPLPRRQVRRRDSSGRLRFTDAEWVLSDGTVLVLEVDGSFHMDAEIWEDDLARHRQLSTPGRIIVRCTTRELRDRQDRVAGDLRSLGLRRLCA